MEDIESELEEDIEDSNLIYINAVNKHININEEVPIKNTDNGNTREYDCMEIIKSTIDMLHEEIEFLKEDIREKNLLIKMLNFRNANNGDKINVDMLHDSNFLSNVETTSRIINETSNAENMYVIPMSIVDYDSTMGSSIK